MEETARYMLMAALGALASVLSNRGIAIFNDGLRPVLPEYFEGRMDRKSLAATSFAISFGLVAGFALPFSIAASILLIHCLLLTTDMIGCFCPAGLKGTILAAAIGALYGVGLLAGLGAVIELFDGLPVNFLTSLGLVGLPIVACFAMFPAVAVGLQFGCKKGLVTALVSLLAHQLTHLHGAFSLGGFALVLNKEGMALLAGMILMIVFAVRDKSGANDANARLARLFEAKVARIRRSAPLLACMGGLIAAAASLSILAGDPISLNLLVEGDRASAAMTAFARALGFIPLVAATAIATGVYAPAGMTFVFAVGLAVADPLLAFLLGALCLGAEVLLLNYAARFLDQFPGVRRCSDNIRTAMGKVLNVALLLGGAMAAQDMAPGLGVFVVVGLYCLNQTSRKPIVDMAIGPVGAILTGLLVNLLALAG